MSRLPTDVVVAVVSILAQTVLFIHTREHSFALALNTVVGFVVFALLEWVMPASNTKRHAVACYSAWLVLTVYEGEIPWHFEVTGRLAALISWIDVALAALTMGLDAVRTHFESKTPISFAWAFVTLGLAFAPLDSLKDSTDLSIYVHSGAYVLLYFFVLVTYTSRDVEPTPLFVLCVTLWTLVVVVADTWPAYVGFAVGVASHLWPLVGPAWGDRVVRAPEVIREPTETIVVVSDGAVARPRKSRGAKTPQILFDAPAPRASAVAERRAPRVPTPQSALSIGELPAEP